MLTDALNEWVQAIRISLIELWKICFKNLNDLLDNCSETKKYQTNLFLNTLVACFGKISTSVENFESHLNWIRYVKSALKI